MLIVPAIDLLGGLCVQLQQGDFERARRYSSDAAAVADGFAQQGALWIHVVDLDAARGSGGNRAAIGRIRKAVDVRVQVGGGVRNAEDAEALLDLGADAVVVGTTLATRAAEVLSWAERWPGRVIGGIDARLGQVQVEGWAESAGGERALIDAMRGSRLAGLIYTAVDRDGMLAGPDLAGGTAAAEASGLPVLFSGGVSSQADLSAIAPAAAPRSMSGASICAARSPRCSARGTPRGGRHDGQGHTSQVADVHRGDSWYAAAPGRGDGGAAGGWRRRDEPETRDGRARRTGGGHPGTQGVRLDQVYAELDRRRR